ncbi:MAG: SDR family NAD(P)-dependent oxidoreductase, partial [Pedobacter sp.]|nr:SDR family NAD(P)-dependent oxidoreductase [Pedobacter sp.]
MNNKVALITGGSKGIGFGIAEALLKDGFKVAITSRSQESADSAAKELNNNENLLALAADV